MALASIAELYCQAGFKVLMIDWDLEAPGLERFFKHAIDPDNVLDKLGVLDMLVEYKKQMAQKWQIPEGTEKTLPFENSERFLVPIYDQISIGGKLWLLTAGRRNNECFSRYNNAVLSFDWSDFYQNWEGERYIEWLRRQFNLVADMVLIDSPSGVTEMSSVCTYHLADTVVMFCNPSQQCINGTKKMAQNFKSPKLIELRGGRPLNVLIILAKLERSENTLLQEFKEEFFRSFRDFVSEENGMNIEELWNLGIPYVPKYAFKEVIFRDGNSEDNAERLKKSFNRIFEEIPKYLEPKNELYSFNVITINDHGEEIRNERKRRL